MSDPDVGEFRTPWLLSWRAFVVTGLLASLPYLNSLHGHFVYDDKVAVMSNPDVTMHALLPISDVFLHDFWGNVMRINLPEWLGLNLTIPKSSWTHNSYRPLTVLSLRFNCWLGGAQPFIYHVTNIVIHIAAVWCGMYALTTLLGRGRRYHAAIASALFACHPVHTEVVTNVTSRAETLGSVFVLLAIGIYFHCTNPHVRSSTPGWLASFLGCLLSFVVVIVAVLCKETGLVTPIMIAALDVIVNTPSMVYNPDNDHKPDRFWRNFLSYVRHILCNMHWLRVVSLVCLQALLLYVRVAWLSSGYELNTSTMHNPFQTIQDPLYRWLSYAFVQALAMTMLVFPVHLSHEHNAMPAVLALSDPRVAVVLVVWTTTVLLLYLAFKREHCVDVMGDERKLGTTTHERFAINRQSRILASIVLIVVPFVPASHMFVQVAFILAERSLFLPSLGACVLIVDAVMWFCARLFPDPPEPVEVTGTEHVEHTETNPSPEPTAEEKPTSTQDGLRHRRHTHKAAAASRPTEGVVDDNPQAKVVGPVWPPLPPHRTRILRRLQTLLGIVVTVCAAYSVRAWVRNYDWLTEEALMKSNLAIYPENNPMSNYGLGARAMYDMKLDEAVAYLHKAIDAAGSLPFVEPHVLLSQIYWSYQYGGDGQHMEKAKAHLRKLLEDNSARRELWANLGLLMYSTERHDPVALNQSEYLILAAAVGHALAPNDMFLGYLWNNAGCIRLLSSRERYGNPEISEREFLKASKSTSPTAIRVAYGNLGMLYALHGLYEEAIDALEAANRQARAMIQANESVADSQDDIRRLAEFATSMIQNEALVRSWKDSGVIVAGKVAEERMQILRGNCKTLLLWL